MEGRLLEFAPVREHALDQALDALLAVGALGPVEHREHGRYRDGVDLGLSLRYQVRILFAGEFADRVVIGEFFGEWDRDQMQPGIGRNFREEVDRLADQPDKRVDLAGP